MDAVVQALRSGWIAPMGPSVDAFEAEICAYVGRRYAVALASGTAALHLGLLEMGIKPGGEVIVPTLTFAATAFAVMHAGGTPVFLDVEDASWGLDPQMLDDVLRTKARAGRRVEAIMPVDLFGRPPDYDSLLSIAAQYEVPVIVDAAESLGSRHVRGPSGSQGHAAAFSFNGNKIMTTSGGGILVSDDAQFVDRARYKATQSRDPVPWYEHREVGFNYRMSNILAALGRAQLARLPQMIDRRREIRRMYGTLLGDVPGLSVTLDPPWGVDNAWLTTITLDSSVHPDAPNVVRRALQSDNIESRPVWKPMHDQPVFQRSEAHISGVADRIFREGLCLPSGVGLADEDIERVTTRIKASLA